jgi:hypothetical protein
LDGLWLSFQKRYGAKGRRVEWQSEYFDRLDLPKLEELRVKVKAEYEKRFPGNETCTPIGFVPSHVADTVIKESGLKPQGLDHMMLRFAITQDIKISEGDWTSGPTGKPKVLKSPLPRSICGF